MKQKTRKFFKISLAFFISVAFAYFALRGVNLAKIYELFADTEKVYILAAFMAIVTGQILRSIRLGVMLQPIEPLSQRVLFPITSVGFMLIMLLPARLGELSRPYLLTQNTNINMSSSIAAVILERILDMLFILAFTAVIVTLLEFPNWVVKGAYFVIVLVASLIAALVFGKMRLTNRNFDKLPNRTLPQKFTEFMAAKINQFYKGMAVIGKGSQFLLVLFLTASIWGVFIFSNWLLFRALHIPLGPFAALTILTLTALGISVPAGPAFLGNFHFFCALGLSMFGVSKDIALGFAVLSHAVVLITFVLLGAVCLNMSELVFGYRFLREPASL